MYIVRISGITLHPAGGGLFPRLGTSREFKFGTGQTVEANVSKLYRGNFTRLESKRKR